MRLKHTQRGFALFEFLDRYEHKCSIQQSSLASESAIWFGIDDPEPKIMASQAAAHGVTTEAINGWVPYPIPEEVSLATRMHLTQEQIIELLPILQYFAHHGALPEDDVEPQAAPVVDKLQAYLDASQEIAETGAYVKHDHTSLLSAAPDMLKALRGMHAAVDVLMARLIELDSTFYPTKSIFWADVEASSALLQRFK